MKLNEFRRNNSKKGRGHPTYIYAKENGEYRYIGISHSPITQGLKNIKLDKNPEPKNKTTAYIRPKSQKDKVSNFGKKLPKWKFADSDKQKVDFVKKRDK